jgi:hypothetical protein
VRAVDVNLRVVRVLKRMKLLLLYISSVSTTTVIALHGASKFLVYMAHCSATMDERLWRYCCAVEISIVKRFRLSSGTVEAV